VAFPNALCALVAPMGLNRVVTTTTRSRKQILDAPCAEAVDLAREAAELAGPGEIGEHLGVEADGERVVTHLFASLHPAYAGWHWAVTVARASRAKNVTVNEAVLLPGGAAVLAPPWVPWTDRLLPGDLGPGDILPTAEDDERLEPGWSGSALETAAPAPGVPDPAVEPDAEDEPLGLLAVELHLTRPRVLSPVGRDDAVDRWYSGERGPHAPLALAAPAQCTSCGFFVPMGGALGRVFGVCANEQAPDDGRVVSLDHGCGAHSEALTTPQPIADRPAAVIDELEYDRLEYDEADDASAAAGDTPIEA
jgi:hypothetical protein